MTTDYGTLVTLDAKSERSEGRTWRYHCGLITHGGALVLLFAMMVSSSWISGVALGQDVSVGLWKACLQGECVSLLDRGNKLSHILGGMVGVQVLAVLSATIYVLSFVYALFLLIFISVPVRNIEGLAVLLFSGASLVISTTALFYFHVYKSLAVSGSGDLHVPFVGYMVVSGLTGLAASLLYVYEHNLKTVQVRATYKPLT